MGSARTRGNVLEIKDLLDCGPTARLGPAQPFLCDNPIDMKSHNGEFHLLGCSDGSFDWGTRTRPT